MGHKKNVPDQGLNPIVTINMGDIGVINIELFPKVAPNTVNNFISLVKKGFYNGTLFHRVLPRFMIQGGDPKGTGSGGPGYSIYGEFNQNGFINNLNHRRGILSMARGQSPNSAGSQFFIMVGHSPHLDGAYAAFGNTFDGMDVVDTIVSSPRNPSDRPLKDQTMIEVIVDTFGQEYPEPETT